MGETVVGEDQEIEGVNNIEIKEEFLDPGVNAILDTKSPVSNIVVNNDISREIANEIRNAALNQLYNSNHMQEHVAIVIYCDAICGHCNASRQQRGTSIDRLLRLLSVVDGYEAFLSRIRNKSMHSQNGNTSIAEKLEQMKKLQQEMAKLQRSIVTSRDNNDVQLEDKDAVDNLQAMKHVNSDGRTIYVNMKHLGTVNGTGPTETLIVDDTFKNQEGEEVKVLTTEAKYPTKENLHKWIASLRGKYRIERKLVTGKLNKIRDSVIQAAINNYDGYKELEIKNKQAKIQRDNDISDIFDKYDYEFRAWIEIIFRKIQTPQNYFIYCVDWIYKNLSVDENKQEGFAEYLNAIRNVLMHTLNGNINIKQDLILFKVLGKIEFVENGKIVALPKSDNYSYIVKGLGGSELLAKLSTEDSGASLMLDQKNDQKLEKKNDKRDVIGVEKKYSDTKITKENIFSFIDDSYLPTATGTDDCLGAFAQSFYNRITVREQDVESDTLATGIAHVEPVGVFADVAGISVLTDFSVKCLAVGRKSFSPSPQYNLTNAISLINASRVTGTLSEVNQPLRLNRDDIDGATMLAISQQVGDSITGRRDCSCADVLLRLRLMQGALSPFCFSGTAGGITNQGFQFLSPLSSTIDTDKYYWPMSTGATALLDTKARLITLGDLMQLATGRLAQDGGWEVKYIGTRIAVIPVLNSWLNNPEAMVIWTLAWMEYPFLVYQFNGLLINDQNTNLQFLPGRTTCASVRVAGPTQQILYVLCDVAKTGNNLSWELQIGLASAPTTLTSDDNYYGAGGVDGDPDLALVAVASLAANVRYNIPQALQWWYDVYGAQEDIESVDLLMPELYGIYRILGKRYVATSDGFFYNDEKEAIDIPNFGAVGGTPITNDETRQLATLSTTPLGNTGSTQEADFEVFVLDRWDYAIGSGNWQVLVAIAGRYAVAANKGLARVMAEPWERTAYRYLLTAEKYGCAFDRVMEAVGMGEYQFYLYPVSTQRQYAVNQWSLVKDTVKKMVYGQCSCRQFSILWNSNEVDISQEYKAIFPLQYLNSIYVGWKRTMPMFHEYFWPDKQIMPRDDYYSLSELGYQYRVDVIEGGYDEIKNSDISTITDRGRSLIKTALTTGGYTVSIVNIEFIFVSQLNSNNLRSMSVAVGRPDEAKLWLYKWWNAIRLPEIGYREILIPQLHPLISPANGNAKLILGLKGARNVTGRKVRGKFLPIMVVLSGTEPITGNPVTSTETYLYPQGVELDL
jgi:hypothetical protein